VSAFREGDDDVEMVKADSLSRGGRGQASPVKPSERCFLPNRPNRPTLANQRGMLPEIRVGTRSLCNRSKVRS